MKRILDEPDVLDFAAIFELYILHENQLFIKIDYKIKNFFVFPFKDIGFIQTDENLWVKYTDGNINVPHFILSTTINPTSQTFLLKNILTIEIISTNSIFEIKEFVISGVRELKLKKLMD